MPLTRPLIALLAGAVLTSSAAVAQAEAPVAHSASFTFFRTPSGLIGCVYGSSPAMLRCDVQYRTRFDGHRRCGEVGDAGRSFTMTRSGRVRVPCVSDAAFDPDSPAIRYGTARRFGPFRCASQRSALTCTNARGHGWSLSRARVRLF